MYLIYVSTLSWYPLFVFIPIFFSQLLFICYNDCIIIAFNWRISHRKAYRRIKKLPIAKLRFDPLFLKILHETLQFDVARIVVRC